MWLRPATGLCSRSSKCLSYRKEKLKMADARLHAQVGVRASRGARTRACIQQILFRSIESEKMRWIDTVRQVDAQRTHRGPIAEPHAHGVHHVVEVGEVALLHAEGELAQAAERIR